MDAPIYERFDTNEGFQGAVDRRIWSNWIVRGMSLPGHAASGFGLRNTPQFIVRASS